MPVPEIPAEVLTKAYRLSYHDAAKHVWSEAWEACTSIYEASIETAVEAEVESRWETIDGLLDDEDSEAYQAIARVVDKLQPGIGPWDKREAVGAIVAEFKEVLDAD